MRLLVPALLLFRLAGHAQLTVVQSCEGLSGRFTGTTPEYKEHPDPAGDVGPAHIVEITGQDFAVYDRSCNQLQRITTKQFFLNAGGTITGLTNEPRVLYNSLIGRWIITTCDGGTGNDYVAVSAGSNPLSSNTAAWKLTTVRPSGVHDDFLRPAWDANGLYVSYYGGSATGHNVNNVTAFSLKDIQWVGTGSITGPSGGFFPNLEYDLSATIDSNPAKRPSDPQLLVDRDYGSGSAQSGTNVPFNLLLRQINWNGGSASTTVTTVPSGYLFNTPTNIAQPGGAIRPNENHRVVSYGYQGSVYAAVESGPCSSGCGSLPVSTHSGFFWFKIDPVARTILDKGYIFDSKMDHSFPGIVVDGNGNMIIVDTCSDASTYPSVCAFYRRPNDPPGQLTGPAILQAGSKTYPGGCNGATPPGWGLYHAPMTDSSDPSKIWTFSEYGEFATTCGWATRIIEFQVGPAAPATVTVDDVVNGGSFLPGIASGTWATVRGQNLAPTTRSWQASDFAGNSLPTSLNGVSVTVAGQRAYVSYISPTQINFLVPDGLPSGPMSVQVLNGSTASNLVVASNSTVNPSFFEFNSRYPAAVHTSGIYLGPPGLLPGSTFAPAVRGETVMLFGTGFGPTTPATPSGQLVTQATSLAATVSVTIGGKPATVVYAGLTASGLDQLNVTVPTDAPSGDQAIVAVVSGSSTQTGMSLTIQ